MIKFMVVGGSRSMFCIGLSAANVEKLKDGKPIRFKGDLLGVAHTDIVVIYGETERALVAELEEAGIKVPPHVHTQLAAIDRRNAENEGGA